MNNWDKYHYVYKNITGTWHEATNPVFIAEHTMCRAIRKGGQPIKDLLYRLNQPRSTK